ncbi:hypothetical protein SF06_28780 [Pseudomonas flexibilis]|nr:hypothetical protein SF06_28780 [Pseudomonas flexibilis]
MLVHTASHVPLQGMATGPREATCFTVVRSRSKRGKGGRTASPAAEPCRGQPGLRIYDHSSAICAHPPRMCFWG